MQEIVDSLSIMTGKVLIPVVGRSLCIVRVQAVTRNYGKIFGLWEFRIHVPPDKLLGTSPLGRRIRDLMAFSQSNMTGPSCQKYAKRPEPIQK